ncbi:MAG TPA: PilZ domain-containing protein [Nitrospira sp.]|nr:PilZ domain-containing protein [Nitrospira sp.]
MNGRYGSRVAVRGKAVVAGERCFCEVRVVNMSLPGCLIECVHGLKVGDYVELRLFLPDQSAPVKVPLAAVRWANRAGAGLEFIRSSPEDQQRLTKFVQKRAPSPRREKKWKDVVTILGVSGD